MNASHSRLELFRNWAVPFHLQSSRAGDSSPQSEALGVRDTVAREVRRLQEAHAEGTGPAVDRQTIIALIRKV